MAFLVGCDSTVDENNDKLDTSESNIKSELLIESDPAEDFDYKIDDDETYITITGYDGDNTDIVIPHIIEGLPVTVIGWSAFEDCEFTSVIIPEGVTTIEGGAFYCCLDLKQIRLPSTLRTIGNAAFDNCSSLTEINIPEGVTTIGEEAFHYCAFSKITIPDSVTSIGKEAFVNCFNLQEVVLSQNLSRIEEFTFWACPVLKRWHCHKALHTLASVRLLNLGYKQLSFQVALKK